MAAADFIAGDTGSKLKITCKDADSQAVIDLTNYTVTLEFRVGSRSLVSRAMTKTNPTAGVAEYAFASGELVAGVLSGQIYLTDGGGKRVTSVDFTVTREGKAVELDSSQFTLVVEDRIA